MARIREQQIANIGPIGSPQFHSVSKFWIGNPVNLWLHMTCCLGKNMEKPSWSHKFPGFLRTWSYVIVPCFRVGFQNQAGDQHDGNSRQKQPPGDEEEAASIPLQLMMQGIFDAILMRTSPRIGRWWGRWFQLYVLIGQRDWFGDCGWIRIVSFCGWIQSSISTCWWIQSVARTSVDFFKRANYFGKGHVESGGM